MRHRKAGRKLSRKSSHRKAMLRNLASSIFKHERVITTTAKAKEVKPFVEKLITKAKENTQANNRYVLMKLNNDKDMTNKLFNEIAPIYKDINGGYTRIIRLGGNRWIDENPKWASNRLGDNAERVIIELTHKTEKEELPSKKGKKAKK